MGRGFSLAAATVLSVGFSLAAHAIISGKKVQPGEYPTKSTVMVLHSGFLETGRGQCTGTLIGADLILTAAHCVLNLKTGELFPPSHFRIYFGNYSGDPKGWNELLAYEVTHVKAHEGYSVSADPDIARDVHDIALMRLSIVASPAFSPAPLLRNLDVLQKGTPVTIAGYGNIRFVGDPQEPKSRLLRTFETEILTSRSEHTGMVEFFRNNNIKTIEDYQKFVGGMASGDSGGPGFVMVDQIPHVFGVASGYRRDIPSYESVPAHLEWLIETAKAMGSEL